MVSCIYAVENRKNKQMKPQILFLFSLLFIFSCNKEDDESGTYAFDESIFGSYSIYYTDATAPMTNACNGPIEATISPRSTTEIQFNNLELTLTATEDDVYTFRYAEGPAGYQTSYSISYYPCADSIVYNRYHNYGYDRGYGKKVGGQNCPDGGTPDFEMMYCHQGPDNVYCYSSINTKINIQLGAISEFFYLATDTINQQIRIGLPEIIEFTLPTDSSYELLAGEYMLGASASEDEKTIVGVLFQEYYYWTIGTTAFEDGYFNVDQQGDMYTLSFQFICSEGVVWTGYYEGAIDYL
jgi:hypothetical protein